MGRVPRPDLGFRARDRHVRLLMGADEIFFLQRKILDRPNHPGWLRGHVDTGVRPTVGRRDVAHFQLYRHSVASLDLPMPKGVGDSLRLLGGAPPKDSPIEHDHNALAGCGRGRADSAKLGNKLGKPRGVDPFSQDFTFVCQVIQQTTGCTIGGVDGA